MSSSNIMWRARQLLAHRHQHQQQQYQRLVVPINNAAASSLLASGSDAMGAGARRCQGAFGMGRQPQQQQRQQQQQQQQRSNFHHLSYHPLSRPRHLQQQHHQQYQYSHQQQYHHQQQYQSQQQQQQLHLRITKRAFRKSTSKPLKPRRKYSREQQSRQHRERHLREQDEQRGGRPETDAYGLEYPAPPAPFRRDGHRRRQREGERAMRRRIEGYVEPGGRRHRAGNRNEKPDPSSSSSSSEPERNDETTPEKNEKHKHHPSAYRRPERYNDKGHPNHKDPYPKNAPNVTRLLSMQDIKRELKEMRAVEPMYRWDLKKNKGLDKGEKAWSRAEAVGLMRRVHPAQLLADDAAKHRPWDLDWRQEKRRWEFAKERGQKVMGNGEGGKWDYEEFDFAEDRRVHPWEPWEERKGPPPEGGWPKPGGGGDANGDGGSGREGVDGERKSDLGRDTWNKRRTSKFHRLEDGPLDDDGNPANNTAKRPLKKEDYARSLLGDKSNWQSLRNRPEKEEDQEELREEHLQRQLFSEFERSTAMPSDFLDRDGDEDDEYEEAEVVETEEEEEEVEVESHGEDDILEDGDFSELEDGDYSELESEPEPEIIVHDRTSSERRRDSERVSENENGTRSKQRGGDGEDGDTSRAESRPPSNNQGDDRGPRKKDRWRDDNGHRAGSGRLSHADDDDNDFGRNPQQTYREGRRHRGQDPTKATVDKGPMTSITISGGSSAATNSRSRNASGSAKYCHGCGATILKNNASRRRTHYEGNNNADGGGTAGNGSNNNNTISMGIQSSNGSYWNQQKEEVRISQIKNWGLCDRCKALSSQNNAEKGGGVGEGVMEALSPSHEMTQVFREQVSKLRSKPDAVVVLCIDAINPHGTMMSKLRNYVGGNPILLAVTRCDLLPDYVKRGWDAEKEEGIKDFFRRLAGGLKIADVYLCSVDDEQEAKKETKNVIRIGTNIFHGDERLANDMYQHLDGRDPYIVGAANIGKSTLTDRLIDNLIEHARRDGTFEDTTRKERHRPRSKKEQKRMRYASERDPDQRRYEDIQKARVTKSSLPGTTLQNIRVPCFPKHTQALWDTPGLLLDPSLGHYPIKDLRRVKAMRPEKILPQWHTVEGRKGFALLVLEKEYAPSSSVLDEGTIVKKERQLDLSILGEDDEGGDDGVLPLLRIEIRLKKSKSDRKGSLLDDKPVYLVWNSTLNNILSTNVAGIEECHTAEKARVKSMEREKQEKGSSAGEEYDLAKDNTKFRTPKEQAQYKEEKRNQFDEQQQAQIAKMGLEQWNNLQKEERHQTDRRNQLSALEKVSENIISRPNVPMEIAIEHFGSLGILAPAECMVRVFAPSKGIRPVCHRSMAVPKKWEEHVVMVDDDDEDDDFSDIDEDYDHELSSSHRKEWNDEGIDEIDRANDNFGYSRDDEEDDSWFEEMDNPTSNDGASYASYESNTDGSNDDRRWAEFSGKKVGWVFDDKPRMVKGVFVDGWNPLREERSQDDE